jgi:hypothetical protein
VFYSLEGGEFVKLNKVALFNLFKTKTAETLA